jgi:hypothetical protein
MNAALLTALLIALAVMALMVGIRVGELPVLD